MRNLSKVFMAIMLVAFLTTGNALALDLGTNITIADLSGSGSGWYGAQEDQEVESGTIANQTWDLEAFFLNGSILTMVGGYDFASGIGLDDNDNPEQWDAGDIFIDIDQDAVYGTAADDGSGYGNHKITNSFGYDYVVDLDFSTNADGTPNYTYTIYSIDENADLLTGYYKMQSTPWAYVSGGTEVDSGDIVYHTGLTDADVGFEGGLHNAVSVDLSFLGASIGNMVTHFTMECGNDNLMGSTPEPATMLLLGSGLMGLAGLRRRFKKN
jgi:hypothetical protein